MFQFLIAALCVLCTEFQTVECAPVVPPAECESPLAFTGGTLWKPESDSTGRLVVLLAPQHDYSKCSVVRKDGAFEPLRFTGRSNGDRQTWRADKPGKSYAGKAKNGGVVCDETCFFPIPGPPGKRHD